MITNQTSLLTEELDNAIGWYHTLNQGGSFSRFGQRINYNVGRLILSDWDPVRFLDQSAALAFVEAAAKNDTDHMERMLSLPHINNDAKYYALIAATQAGCTRAIALLLKLNNLEEIISEGMLHSHTYFAIDRFLKTIDYQKARQMDGKFSLYARMGLSSEPNLLIEAARHNRLDVLRHLQQFQFIRNMMNPGSYGYYACLRAAEQGHLKVMNEFFNVQSLRDQILLNGDALRFAAENGHLDVVERLLEFGLPHNINLASFIRGTLQYGTVMVVDRLLREEDIDSFFNYEGEDAARISEIETAAYYACYSNTKKNDDTAARMFNLLLKYPVVARLAEKEAAIGSGEMWEVLQRIEKLGLNPVVTYPELDFDVGDAVPLHDVLMPMRMLNR